MIRDKSTGQPASYCFLDFFTPTAAARALSLNGSAIPGTHKPFRLNWSQTSSNGAEFQVFVGDISPEVTEQMLLQLFSSRFYSVKSARIVFDPVTNVSKSFGFVKFGDESEQMRAIGEMNGAFCGSRPIRVAMASKASKPLAPVTSQYSLIPQYPTGPLAMPVPLPLPVNIDYTSTVVCVSGMPMKHRDITNAFHHFGEILEVRIIPSRQCAYIQFASNQSAQMAIQNMNGANMGYSVCKVAFGKMPEKEISVKALNRAFISAQEGILRQGLSY